MRTIQGEQCGEQALSAEVLAPCVGGPAPDPASCSCAPPAAAPPELIHAIGRAVMAIHRLQRDVGVVYERVVEKQGLERCSERERGSPLVWHPQFGCFGPVDDEDAAFGAVAIQREDADGVDEWGARYSVTRLVRVPVRAAALRSGGFAAQSGEKSTASRGEGLPVVPDDLDTNAEGVAEFLIAVHDDRAWPRPPSRAMCARVSRRHGALPEMAAVRRMMLERRDVARRERQVAVESAVVSAGGQVVRRYVRATSGLRVRLPRSAAAQIGKMEAVASIQELSVAESTDSLSTNYLCTGIPNYLIGPYVDSKGCLAKAGGDAIDGSGFSTQTVVVLLGGKVAATGGYAYIDEGYTGAGNDTAGLRRSAAGGLAEWASGWDVVSPAEVSSTGESVARVVAYVPHVAVGVIDPNGVQLAHPALLDIYGESRVKYYLDAGGTLHRGPDYQHSQPLATSPHGTNVAAVAVGNVTDGQDSRVPSPTSRELRSGMSRRALAVAANAGGAAAACDFFEMLATGQGSDEWLAGRLSTEGGLGLDVVAHSHNGNSGGIDPGAAGVGNGQTLYDCPTNAQARGTDDVSIAVTTAFLEQSMLYVHSAGNMHGSGTYSVQQNCTTGPRSAHEVSSPAASPAALSVGATGIVNNGVDTADGVQAQFKLYELSAGGRTKDGRIYPLMVAQGWACGTPGSKVE